MSETYQPRSYTSARRYPGVLANIAGVPLLWPMSPTQVGVFAAAFVVLIATRGAWTHLGQANAVVLVGVPAAAAWAVRHLRPEGRSPAAAARGALVAAGARRAGRVRPQRQARALGFVEEG